MTVVDLRTVDELCRLAVVARGLGCRVHLVGTDPELRSLLDLAGLDEVLSECPATDAGPSGHVRSLPTRPLAEEIYDA